MTDQTAKPDEAPDFLIAHGGHSSASQALARCRGSGRNTQNHHRREAADEITDHEGRRAVPWGAALAQDVTAAMQSELGTQVLEGCNSELVQYCAEGHARRWPAAGLSVRLRRQASGECESALYNAAVRLERAIDAIAYVASKCRAELETHCVNVEVGEGHVAQCLKDHTSELTPGATRR